MKIMFFISNSFAITLTEILLKVLQKPKIFQSVQYKIQVNFIIFLNNFKTYIGFINVI